MAHSFDANGTGALAQLNSKRRRVAVTGGAGRIGSYFAEKLHDKYDLVLIDRNPDDLQKVASYGETATAELSELEKLTELFQGADTVIHLAGDPSPGQTWSSVIENNITGTYNAFVAAKAAGCRRIIYASSIHAVSGYPADVQVKTSEPVNPGDLYGVSKCFGEALGRYMANQEGVSVIALRIGAFQPESTAEKPDLGMMHGWVSQRDLIQLMEKCIDVENVRFAVLHALSENTFKRLDITDARELVGYAPEDNFSDFNPLIKDLNLDEHLQTHSGIQDSKDPASSSGLREELQELNS